MPQIEVSFALDANGMLHVSASDGATGRAQHVTVAPSSGLSEADVDRMMQEAVRYHDHDRRRQATIALRNEADALLKASGMPPLYQGQPAERMLLQSLRDTSSVAPAAGGLVRGAVVGLVARGEEDSVVREAAPGLGPLEVARVFGVAQVQLAGDVDVVGDVPEVETEAPEEPVVEAAEETTTDEAAEEPASEKSEEE